MNGPSDHPIAQVTVTTPVRIADVGGWTDTWFARTGAVCHLGVGPGVTVQAVLHDAPLTTHPVRLIAPDISEDYPCGPSTSGDWADPEPGRHPLLEHAVAAVCRRFAPPGPITLTITSAVPPGASLGTSASVVVAVITALEQLVDPEAATTSGAGLSHANRRRLAVSAHQVETEAAARESGVQDQWAAAFGAAQFLEITDYPQARQTTIALPDALRSSLDDQVVTVVLGGHDSSMVHAEVIAALAKSPVRSSEGPPEMHGEASDRRRSVLAELADLAFQARDALAAGDFASWAAVLTAATQAQERLHSGLIGANHRSLIDLARAHHAAGWKVNGAGGDAGSLTVAFATATAAHAFTDAVSRADPTWLVPRLRLQPGVTVSYEE